MGVPAFFRWLSRKYSSVVVYCVEEKAKVIDGVVVPVDASKPNPNGVEFDNLYLDMNGIIHPCTHPEDKPAPKNEDEMMIAIFECIDRLFCIVRPRKLLYMAIDGVAPRAKMNQQRSRRFRASKESFEKIEEVTRIRSELLAKGVTLPSETPKESHFDSNCITPGTPFMERLSECLHYYIHERLNNDPGWKGLKVILSDANVPGEGEHKIMDFIRKQRAQPDHNPNTQHCLCGADADLIMLGLATHEPNFTIIREEFKPVRPKPCDICHQYGHEMKDCTGCFKPNDDNTDISPLGEEVQYIFVRLSVLREYLEQDLLMPNLPFKYDFERVIDDWVFMCFFVGNDFLPHLPSLEIREGAIDRLVNLYKNCVYKTGGFVTDSGDLNLHRVQIILNELGKVEDEIFKKRQQTALIFRQREKQRKKFAFQNKDGKPTAILGGQYTPNPLGPDSKPLTIQNPRQEAYRSRLQNLNTHRALESLILMENSEAGSSQQKDKYNSGIKRSTEEQENSSEEEDHDEVRLWEEGFKDRYYESKFEVEKENVEFRIRVANEYVKGLCWVLRYYYQGCASWKWFFPYHYAPFASDFINIGDLKTTFEKGTEPFKPLEQLMGVFPAASSSHVPEPWAALMHDPESPIIDFYPTDFKIDLNGKKFAWQGVALLPFVNEKRLFKALEPYYNQLTPAEKKRNVKGDDRIYLGIENSGYSFLKGLYEGFGKKDEEFDICIDGMRGKVLLSEHYVMNETLKSPVGNLPAIEDNTVVFARFKDLTYEDDFIFKANRLKGVIEPPRVLKPKDLTYEQSRNWRPQIGMVPSMQQASLDGTGHRMLNYYNSSFQRHNQKFLETIVQNTSVRYNQVPPPTTMSLFPQFKITQSVQNYGYRTAQGSSQANSRNNRDQMNDNRREQNYQNYYERNNFSRSNYESDYKRYHPRDRDNFNRYNNDRNLSSYSTGNQDFMERRYDRINRDDNLYNRRRSDSYKNYYRGYHGGGNYRR